MSSGVSSVALAPPVIEIDGVRKRFGSHVAIERVSLELGEGRFVTLLGPSGCGKTTLLRMIGGLETPDEGTIRVAGRPVSAFSPTDRPTRMVFQSYALFPHMTVERNVGYGLRRRRMPEELVRARVAEQLAVVGLTDKARAYPSELSGGQQQRVALARALVTQPKVLLLDEPLAALDLKLRQRMQSELKALQRSAAITFVYVTHDQHEALGLSDEVVVMQEGKIAQRGAPDEIYHRPSNRYVAEFVGDTTTLEGTVRSLANGEAMLETVIGRFRASAPGALPGARACAVIRPEEVQVVLPGAGTVAENTVAAVVDGTTYRGADLLIDLVAANDVRLRASIPATRPEALAATPGAMLTLHLPAAALWLIPPGESSLEKNA